MTYPHSAVVRAITERFVPLKLDLHRDRAVVRTLNVIWTPTLLVADRRGTVHYQAVNFHPPDDFLDLLDISEANALMRWGRYDEAISRLRDAEARHLEGALIPEATYWRGIATYLKTRSNDELYAVWTPLRERYPASIWAARVPWPPD